MRLHRDSKVELLKKVPLFARCSTKELRQIAAIADEVRLDEGTRLTHQGDRGREFFVLLEGTVDVHQDDRKIGTRGPGDFLGEIALVTRGPRTATVTATSPLDVLVITGGDFRTLLRKSPEIQVKVLEALAERLERDSL
jgi:CRP/FNR family transcriptional regulator, cyclic AMP receptor protein